MVSDPLHSSIRKQRFYRRFKLYKQKTIKSVIAIGDIGLGKSVSIATVSHVLRNLGYKIVDLYSAARMEGAFRALPSRKSFWQTPKRVGAKVYKKQSIPTKLFYPMSNKLPDQLPADISNVFTIPINSLDTNDLKAILGENLSTSVQALWESALDQVDETTGPYDFQKILERLIRKEKMDKKTDFGYSPSAHGMNQLSNNFLRPMMRNKMLSSAKNPMAINLKKEMNKKKEVFVLILRHTPTKLHNFIVNYFINHIFKLAREKDIKTIPYLQLREISDLLRDDMTNAAELAIKNNIIKILKQGRTGTHFLADTQHPEELPAVKNQFNVVICHRTGSLSKTLELAGHSERSANLSRDDKIYIHYLRTGECYVFNKQNSNVLKVKTLLPPHAIWEAGEDFYKVWAKYSDKKQKWVNTKSLTFYIDEELRKAKEKWQRRKILELDKKIRKKGEMKKHKKERELKERLEERKKGIDLEIELKKYKDKKMKELEKERKKKKKEEEIKIKKKNDEKQHKEHQNNTEKHIDKSNESKIENKGENISNTKKIHPDASEGQKSNEEIEKNEKTQANEDDYENSKEDEFEELNFDDMI